MSVRKHGGKLTCLRGKETEIAISEKGFEIH